MTTNQPLSLFISSKMTELAPERRAIQTALSLYRMSGWLWEDDAGARPQSIRSTYLEEVEACDVYIGLFWLGYGPATIEEFEYARRLRKSCLIYEKHVQIDQRSPELTTFLENIQQVDDPGSLTICRFETPDQLAEWIQRDVILLLATRFRKSRQQPSSLSHRQPINSEASRPKNYIPFPRNPLFQPRPDEFEQLENLLFGKQTQQKPARIGLVGMVGMGGVGKTQLAIELAYRYQDRFPGGIFWMSGIGTNLFDWQHHLAELALNTGYLPPYDDISNPENEVRRARHWCHYLAYQASALLILDNVEDPSLLISALPALAGGPLACSILYTSRSKVVPLGVTMYPVEALTEEGALRLLLEGTRTLLLSEILAGSQEVEAETARSICQGVGYLPLALVHLRGLLVRDPYAKLVRLAEVLRQRGALDVAKTQSSDATPLFVTFWLSWEKVHSEGARRLFKLASYYPEATPIPLWLLGLAAGLGENRDIFEPLGEARAELLELSLLEELSGDNIWLHPLVREFARLVAEKDGDYALREGAGERLVSEFENPQKLELRALRDGYWNCLEQVRTALEYAKLLRIIKIKQLIQMERRLDRESYVLGNSKLWPDVIPGLFYQQLYNRSVEEGQTIVSEEVSSKKWLRQMAQMGIDDPALIRVFAGHMDSVESVSFSPDGTKILTGSDDGMVRLWEMNSGKLLAAFGDYDGSVKSVAFSQDGKKILVGTETDFGVDDKVELWEVSSEKLLVTFGNKQGARSVAFSPDGTKVLTGSNDGNVRLWDASNGKLLSTFSPYRQISRPSERGVTSVAFSPDGLKILAGFWNGTMQQYTMKRKNAKPLIILEGYKEAGTGVSPLEDDVDAVTSIAISPDGTKILIGFWYGSAELREIASRKLLFKFEGHSEGMTSVAYSNEGTKLLTGFGGGEVQLWEASNGKLLATFKGHSYDVNCLAFSPDDMKILTGSFDRTVRLWEISRGKPQDIQEEYEYSWECVAFSNDGMRVLAGSMDGTASLWEVSSGRLLARFNQDNYLVRGLLSDGTEMQFLNAVTCVTFSLDDTKVFIGTQDGRVHILEVNSGELVATLKHRGGVSSLALSNDGTKVVTGSQDETAKVWEINNGRLLATLRHKDSVTCVAYSPDGTQVLTGSWDEKIRLWEVDSKKLLKTFKSHEQHTMSVNFSPDGSKVLAGSNSGLVQLWETGTGKSLVAYESNGGYIDKVAFSQDGSLIVACDMYGQVRLLKANEPQIGDLLGLYVAGSKIEAIHWQSSHYVLLADNGGSRYRPRIYRLKLEGF